MKKNKIVVISFLLVSFFILSNVVNAESFVDMVDGVRVNSWCATGSCSGIYYYSWLDWTTMPFTNPDADGDCPDYVDIKDSGTLPQNVKNACESWANSSLGASCYTEKAASVLDEDYVSAFNTYDYPNSNSQDLTAGASPDEKSYFQNRCYYSKAPTLRDPPTKESSDGNIYQYVMDWKYISYISNVDYSDPGSSEIKSVDGEVVDVYHLGVDSEDEWGLYDSSNNGVTDISMDDLIWNMDAWRALGLENIFYPVNNITLSGNRVVYDLDSEQYSNNGYKSGINIKHRYQWSDVISTKYYVPYVLKVKIGEESKQCTYDREAGKFYNMYGDEITDANPQQAFVNSCLCELEPGDDYSGNHKKANADNIISELGDVLTPETIEYYQTVCPVSGGDPSLEPPGGSSSTRTCTKTYEPKICDPNDPNTSKQYTIGDDLECVLSKQADLEKYNTYITDGSASDKNQYTDYTNDYCNISCAEELTFTVPTKKKSYAGQYFTIGDLENIEVKVTGEKTCRGYIGTSKLTKELEGNGSSDQTTRIKDTLVSINNTSGTINFGFKGVTNDNYNGYGLINQLNDLAQLYKDFNLVNNYGSWSIYSPGSGAGPNGETILNSYPTPYGMYTNYYCQTKTTNITGIGTLQYFSNNNGNTCPMSNYLYLNTDGNLRRIATGSSSARDSVVEEIKGNIQTAYKAIEDKIKNAKINISECISRMQDTSQDADGKYKDKAHYKNYEIDPYIDFNYSEGNYNDMISGDSDFEAVKVEKSPGILTGSLRDYSYNYNGFDGDIKNVAFEGNDNDYLDYEVSMTKDYISKTIFYRMPGSGIITISPSDLTQELGRVFPVALNKKSNYTGQSTNSADASIERVYNDDYDYDLRFTRLGSNLDGTVNSHLDKYTTETGVTGFNYTCYYDVDNDIVRISDEDYDEGTDFKQNYFYRSISLNNVNPQNRILGKNWNVGEGTPDTEFEKKASVTIKSIEEEAEKIYNDSEAEYSFTLTPEAMQAIRGYNQDQEDDNGYQNFDMTVYKGTIQTIDADGNKGTIDLSSEVGEDKSLKHYEWYKSKFIDNLKDNYGATKVEYDKGRANWTVWRKSDSDSVIGPAWK